MKEYLTQRHYLLLHFLATQRLIVNTKSTPDNASTIPAIKLVVIKKAGSSRKVSLNETLCCGAVDNVTALVEAVEVSVVATYAVVLVVIPVATPVIVDKTTAVEVSVVNAFVVTLSPLVAPVAAFVTVVDDVGVIVVPVVSVNVGTAVFAGMVIEAIAV